MVNIYTYLACIVGQLTNTFAKTMWDKQEKTVSLFVDWTGIQFVPSFTVFPTSTETLVCTIGMSTIELQFQNGGNVNFALLFSRICKVNIFL